MCNNNSPAVVVMDNVTVNSGAFTYGTTVDLFKVYSIFTAQIIVSGFSGSGTIAVDVEGSLDGVNWYVLTNIPGGTTVNADDFHTSDGAYGSKPARYVRAYGVQFSGSPSASVTVNVVGS